MKKLFNKNADAERKNTIAMKGGMYSIAVSAVVLAIVIVINILASALPSSLTKLDISSARLYSITGNTKVVLNSLDKDVTVYWIVQSGEEDSIVENLLSKYESASSHVEVVKKNPDVYPTFASQYTDESVSNNSLIVECGDKSRYVAYDEIYVAEIDYTTYSYTYSFDGEGVLTSAIDYVVSEDLPKLYILTGHGEYDLPEAFSEQLKKENTETESLSLLQEDGVPEDADCLVIYSPASDISEEEAAMLTDYADNGGKLLVFAGPTESGTLANLYSVIAAYGVEADEGIVIEGDSDHYAFQMPYILMPDIQSSNITDSLIDEGYYALVPIAGGMKVTGSGNGSVTELLTSSEASYCKSAGYELQTYEKEDGDTDGPFALAVSVETYGGGEIVWVSSSYFLDDSYNEYSSGANLDFAMNAVSELVGESDSVAIRSKSLSYNYLTISDTTASALKTVMIGLIPAAFLIAGIVMAVTRRQRKNEQG